MFIDYHSTCFNIHRQRKKPFNISEYLFIYEILTSTEELLIGQLELLAQDKSREATKVE